MKRIRLAALLAVVVLAGASAPARADDGGILGDPGKVSDYTVKVQRFYEQFNHYVLAQRPVSDLDAIEAAIVQSQHEILTQIHAIPATQVQACSATAVQQFANIDRMSADTLMAFAADSVACVNAAAADIGVETDKAAIDRTGFALNIVGPIALFASADANERTDILTESLIAADQLLIQQLKPWCRISVLSPDNLPSVGSGGVTGHAGCLNYTSGRLGSSTATSSTSTGRRPTSGSTRGTCAASPSRSTGCSRTWVTTSSIRERRTSRSPPTRCSR